MAEESFNARYSRGSTSIPSIMPRYTVAKRRMDTLGSSSALARTGRSSAVGFIRSNAAKRFFQSDSSNPRATSSAEDRKSTRLNSSHVKISYAVFCLKKKSHRRGLQELRPARAFRIRYADGQ